MTLYVVSATVFCKFFIKAMAAPLWLVFSNLAVTIPHFLFSVKRNPNKKRLPFPAGKNNRAIFQKNKK
jgi:hypothetical protein